MCTVIVGFKLSSNTPVVLAANRDELLDRPAQAPQVFVGTQKILAPTDMVRGGTWIGVNARGVFAALTNRTPIASVWDPNHPERMRTRGSLVYEALAHQTAAEAIADIARIRTRAFNGFHLVVGDAVELFTAIGGGVGGPEAPLIIRHASAPSLLIVTNLGIGPNHSPRAEAIMRIWNAETLRLRHETPHRALWDHLLTIHDAEPHTGNNWMKRMASTCIHRPEAENYGTRSSAFVVLDAARGAHPHHAYPAEWRYWHRERPDKLQACQGRWDPVRILPIRE